MMRSRLRLKGLLGVPRGHPGHDLHTLAYRSPPLTWHALEAASLTVVMPPQPPSAPQGVHQLDAIDVAAPPKGRPPIGQARLDAAQADLKRWITNWIISHRRDPTQKQSRAYIKKQEQYEDLRDNLIIEQIVRPVHQELRLRTRQTPGRKRFMT
jgi:hypothetical protein